MRKCDICHTTLPFGENRCPNCGYRMPKERNVGEQKSAREAKKKIYMAQFQPHPNSANRMKKTMGKKIVRQSARPGSNRKVFMIILACILISLLLPIIISPVVSIVDEMIEERTGENTEESVASASEYQEYESLVSLQRDYPYLTADIESFQAKAVTKLEGYDSFYESYDVYQGKLSVAYFSYSIYEYPYGADIIYSYYGNNWQESFLFYVSEDADQNALSQDMIALAADYMEIDRDELYKKCEALIQESENEDAYLFDDMIVTEEAVSSDTMLEMVVDLDDNGEWEYVSFELVRDYESGIAAFFE